VSSLGHRSLDPDSVDTTVCRLDERVGTDDVPVLRSRSRDLALLSPSTDDRTPIPIPPPDVVLSRGTWLDPPLLLPTVPSLGRRCHNFPDIAIASATVSANLQHPLAQHSQLIQMNPTLVVARDGQDTRFKSKTRVPELCFRPLTTRFIQASDSPLPHLD
jgi:hypothetical protein